MADVLKFKPRAKYGDALRAARAAQPVLLRRGDVDTILRALDAMHSCLLVQANIIDNLAQQLDRAHLKAVRS